MFFITNIKFMTSKTFSNNYKVMEPSADVEVKIDKYNVVQIIKKEMDGK